MARPRKYTAEQLEKLVDAACKEIESSDLPPTAYRVVYKYMGLDYSTFFRWVKNEPDENGKRSYDDYAKPLKRLLLCMQDWFVRKGDTRSIFALKQELYGGWKDKPVLDVSAKELTVNIQGLGDKAGD